MRNSILYIRPGFMLFVFLSWSVNAPGQVQSQPSPLSNFVLAGYGSATYDATLASSFGNNFTASVSPVILYSMGEDVLFETELEFGLSGEATTTALEYAQIDYLGFERVQFIAGKFLLPFGLFGERLHPSWVNKMPSSPLLYGHAHGGVAEGALLPILSDAGLMMRYKQAVNSSWDFDVTLWVSQGPRLVAADDGAGDGDGHVHARVASAAFGTNMPTDTGTDAKEIEVEVPDVGFGVAFADNNKNKMLGARIGLVKGPGFEVYVSGFHAMYDEENFLDIAGTNLSIDWRRGLLDIRGEGILLWQEFPFEAGYETLSSTGYYIQAARRLGSFEPVVRWSHLPEATFKGSLARIEQRELALGLNYWINASIPIKLAYAVNFDGEDHVLLQWAFGF